MSETKALHVVVDNIIDLFDLGRDIIAKKGTVALFADAEKLLVDVPALVPNFGEVVAEAKALDAAGETDLVAYVAVKLADPASAASPKAIAVTKAALGVLVAGYELEKALTA